MMAEKKKFDTIVFRGIVVVLVVAPLAFGSVHPWAYCLLEMGVLVMMGLWWAARLVFRGAEPLEWVATPVNVLMFLVLGWVLVQVVPLPSSWIATLSPHTFADKKLAWELLEKAPADAALNPEWMAFSYYLHPTLLGVLKWATCVALFFLVLNTVKSRRRIDTLVYVSICVGLFQVLYAAYQGLGNDPQVWGLALGTGMPGSSRGTFADPDAFAVYLELTFCIALGFLLAQGKRVRTVAPAVKGLGSTLRRAVARMRAGSVNPRAVHLFPAVCLLGGGLVLSGSRGAMVSVGFGTLLLALLLWTKKGHFRRGLLVLGFSLLVLIGGLTLHDTGTKDPQATQGTISMLADYKAMGVGLGNFGYLRPKYTEGLYGAIVTAKEGPGAWAEMAAETGIGGGVLLVSLGLAYLGGVLRTWYTRRDNHALGLGAGAAAAALCAGFHSLFDSAVVTPANAFTLAVVLGVGHCAVHREGHGYSESFFYPVRTVRLGRGGRIGLMLTVAAVLLVGFLAAGRHWMAEIHCPVEFHSTVSGSWSGDREAMEKAMWYNPSNAQYHHRLALSLSGWPPSAASAQLDVAGPDHPGRLSPQETETDPDALPWMHFRRAALLNPAQAEVWYGCGRFLSGRKEDPYQYVTRWLPLAERCFDVSVHFAPRDGGTLFDVASFWVWRSSLLSEGNETSQGQGMGRVSTANGGIGRFQELFRRSLELDPQRWEQAARTVWQYHPDDGVVFGIVPPQDEELKRLVLRWLAVQGENAS